MSSQQSIKRFFSPKQQQKALVNQGMATISPKSGDSTSSPVKTGRKRKSSDNEEANEEAAPATTTSPMASPEAKKLALDNKTLAKIKLRSKELSGALDASIGPTWFASLQKEFEKPYFAELSRFLERERASQTIYPPSNQVWSWTRDFPVSATRVVILGQDPYHGPGQAHGLCFSVQKGTKIPPSLVNMYKELRDDQNINFKHPGHGFLQGWADQGVLLLNACLTVREKNANSHKDRGWEKITDAAVKAVSDECPPGVVFLLWGSHAQKKASAVDGSKHHLLKSVHPSPLSAHRGFLGCRHFSKCNELLEKSGRKPVDWSKLT